MNPVPIHAFNPGPITGSGNWTWLIAGSKPTLIDAGTGDARHVQGVIDALSGASLAQVLVTHSHGDHASGAATLAQRFPAARFKKAPWPGRDERWQVPWDKLQDGDAIPAGDTTLIAVHTPGHAPDNLCFWQEESRTVFCGDLAIKGSSVWIPAGQDGDVAAYLNSLQRILSLDPARLLPAHGPPIEDPARLLRMYIQHRQQREEQILAALRAGHSTADAIVGFVYEGLSESLVPLAKESVLAHLMKLRREGRIRGDTEGWQVTE